MKRLGFIENNFVNKDEIKSDFNDFCNKTIEKFELRRL